MVLGYCRYIFFPSATRSWRRTYFLSPLNCQIMAPGIYIFHWSSFVSFFILFYISSYITSFSLSYFHRPRQYICFSSATPVFFDRPQVNRNQIFRSCRPQMKVYLVLPSVNQNPLILSKLIYLIVID